MLSYILFGRQVYHISHNGIFYICKGTKIEFFRKVFDVKIFSFKKNEYLCSHNVHLVLRCKLILYNHYRASIGLNAMDWSWYVEVLILVVVID